MWSSIFEILLDVYTKVKDDKKNNHQRLSKVLGDISNIIDSCIELMQQDIYPYNYCQIMEALSKDIVNELGDYLNMTKLVELESLLLSCSRLELEYANRKENKTINQLIVASARFKSLSILYQ
jgi:hypothetical protein